MHDARAEAGRWLASAEEDLGYARHAAEGQYHAPACFFAQQAAEKAVKVAHYLRGARAVIGHNVRALIETLDPRDASFDALRDAARELDLFYIPARYPNGRGTPGEALSRAQSARALELAKRFLEAARAVLG